MALRPILVVLVAIALLPGTVSSADAKRPNFLFPRVTLRDEDAGPTKAWLVGMRKDPKWRSHYEWVSGLRDNAELYELKSDPHPTKNVATDPASATVRAELGKRRLDELKRTGDPRFGDVCKFFDTPPITGPRISAAGRARTNPISTMKLPPLLLAPLPAIAANATH